MVVMILEALGSTLRQDQKIILRTPAPLHSLARVIDGPMQGLRNTDCVYLSDKRGRSDVAGLVLREMPIEANPLPTQPRARRLKGDSSKMHPVVHQDVPQRHFFLFRDRKVRQCD